MDSRVLSRICLQTAFGGKMINTPSHLKIQTTIRDRLEEFFFAPGSARPLAVLRIALGLCLLAQVFLLRHAVSEFFTADGLIQGDLSAALTDPSLPQLSWFDPLLTHYGISQLSFVTALGWFYIASLILFCFGFFTRTATFAAWALQWFFMNTGSTTAYGVDLYTHVFLFYLMFMPSGDAYSVDAALKGARDIPSSYARLCLRVLQLHLCLAYFASGVDKAMGIQWWNGELLWRALNLPLYKQFDMTWLANWPLLLKAGGWSTLVMELGYFIFIWPKSTRRLWILGIMGLHIGIAIFLGLGLFGMVMAILTPALFAVSSEPTSEATTELPLLELNS
jgi:hypothetical protein